MRPPHLLAAMLVLAACSSQPPARLVWLAPEGQSVPMLMFGLPESDVVDFRLSCEADGVRLAAFVGAMPRGLTADDQQFETRMRLFLGKRELDLPARGLTLASGDSLVEARLADPAGLLAAVAQQGRLVAITFAGRTTAPAPPAGLLAGFRSACPAAGVALP